MSTRSTTHFIGYGRTEPDAIIYRHSDGYPEGHGLDLQKFFDDVEAQCSDTRYSDPSYLAAKLVVWLADMFAPYSQPMDYSKPWDKEEAKRKLAAKLQPLNFISVGVVSEDPGDIEYRYTVDCSNLGADGRPIVTCYSIYEKRNVPIEAEVEA